MANIIRKIANNITSATGLTFLYGGNEKINTIIEKAPLPCAIAYLVDSSQIIDEAGSMKERLNMAVFFVNKTHFDCDSLENEDVIDEMKQAALKWLQVARREASSNGFVVGEVSNAQRIYDTFDVIVTGYGVTVQVEELMGVTQCDTYPVGDE